MRAQLRRSRRRTQVKAALQKRLLKETFQSYDEVAMAFAIAGIEKAWSKVASKLGTKADDIKDRLGGLVLRRKASIQKEGPNEILARSLFRYCVSITSMATGRR